MDGTKLVKTLKSAINLFLRKKYAYVLAMQFISAVRECCMKVDVDIFQKLVDKSIKLVDKQSKVLDKSQNCSSLMIFVAVVALRPTFAAEK
ncbi:hypothetical protein [Lysinibacillus sp. fls2-241-R2A-57]|uniref:hypothetical protein n=2 Tax=unclassified Lysinibacillus TaxID=2636778 RepID=UPI002553D5D0|nr:hypothetical protein [Lysinibacillus sp. fls2-241-R2A-57]